MKRFFAAVAALALLFVSSALLAQEKLMIDPVDLKLLVIQPTLTKMEARFPGAADPAAVNCLSGIAAHESTVGVVTRLKQVSGPALGIYQIEPATHKDVWRNYLSYRPDASDLLLLEWVPDNAAEALHQPGERFVWSIDDRMLITNLAYATAIARVILYRQSFDWPVDPGDVEALAVIWKNQYNTAQGSGTVEQYVAHFPTVVLE